MLEHFLALQYKDALKNIFGSFLSEGESSPVARVIETSHKPFALQKIVIKSVHENICFCEVQIMFTCIPESEEKMVSIIN